METRMSDYPFALVDVFAEVPLQGNPLAVVDTATGLSDDVMRKLGAEFNQAETTFIFPSTRATRKLRSFTAAGSEVFGAGHNAIGAWIWLGETGQLGALDEPVIFRQEIGEHVLPIRVWRQDGRIHGAMRQAALTLGRTIDDLTALAAALDLGAGDLMQHPGARVADTGANLLMVRASSRDVVDAARPEARALLPCLRDCRAEGCYLYAFDEGAPEVAYARFFNPTVGLWEDAATGTAAGPLCAYLDHQGLLSAKKRLAIEQGRLMGRPSILTVVMAPDAELSGSGTVVMKGHLAL
jgi:PhzF family phenazine biosynthesis protein